ncbi:serine/threonine protein kinase [Urbifossiella limnaea]|uniref:Serine/threonine-protein kinase PrkC n=1 Tax=Urbifossiella limnaea TaxID=2528023 RepID=A0A517XY73_9BACT|nr:serine/threonine-protein kinase [Urbifossiella limnaea]QDU22441.1 Serine/threonine-protein kinase PrkC [Urbifossiella limnaea]
MKFTHRSGQRPLDGFTIKRGVGQGGFGEVYFAVSDAGKEVALKLLFRHQDAELRGIAHCLNLKHPNLVHLYDLRTDDRGAKWVVMEYVFGESLAQWINRYPTGLPSDLVREWFAAIGRGVAYLHEQGVVHRDLKPANIFVENGHLKIGDYGLSRRISLSQGGELTQGVGTPHYMAPEIKSGNYTQSIDIYACGVMLFEMLTGLPPFEGQTPMEVLVKHLTDTPDLAKVPAAYRAVVGRALEKDPAVRYPTMREFVRAVEEVGSDPVTKAVPVGLLKTTAVPVASPPAGPLPDARVAPVAAPPSPRFASGPIPVGVRTWLTQRLGAFALAPVVAGLCTAPFVLFGAPQPWSLLGRMILLSTALSWGALSVARTPKDKASGWGRKFQMLLVGLALGGFAFWLDGWSAPSAGPAVETGRDLTLGSWARVSPELFSTATRYALYYGLAVAACPWWGMTNRNRKERFKFGRVVLTGLAGGVLLFLWPWGYSSAMLSVFPLVIASVAVQVVSPWQAPPPPPPRPQVVRGPAPRRRQYA